MVKFNINDLVTRKNSKSSLFDRIYVILEVDTYNNELVLRKHGNKSRIRRMMVDFKKVSFIDKIRIFFHNIKLSYGKRI